MTQNFKWSQSREAEVYSTYQVFSFALLGFCLGCTIKNCFSKEEKWNAKDQRGLCPGYILKKRKHLLWTNCKWRRTCPGMLFHIYIIHAWFELTESITLTLTRKNIQQIILQVLDESKIWWKIRNMEGQEGFAPHTILHKTLLISDITEWEISLKNLEGLGEP